MSCELTQLEDIFYFLMELFGIMKFEFVSFEGFWILQQESNGTLKPLAILGFHVTSSPPYWMALAKVFCLCHPT